MAAEDLEARVRLLEDIEAIKKLRATYTYLVDTAQWDELMTHFTEDSRGDYGAFGTYEGKAAVTNFFKEIIPPVLTYMMHMVHNPIIEVQGDKATGQWYFEVPSTHGPSSRATLILGKYEEKYAKEGGKWKFQEIVARIDVFTPLDEGWVKTKMYGG